MTKLGTFIILQKRRNAGYYDRLDERRDRRISSEKIASIVNFESMLYFLTHMPYALGRSWTHRFQWGSMDPELQIPPAPPRIRSWKIIRIFSKLGSGIPGCSTTLMSSAALGRLRSRVQPGHRCFGALNSSHLEDFFRLLFFFRLDGKWGVEYWSLNCLSRS